MDILWIGAAFLLGILFSRIQLPPLIGYLSAGLILAATGYESGDLLHQIAHFGVLFLLFSVGLHIRIRDILRLEVLAAGVSHLIIFTGIIWGILIVLSQTGSLGLSRDSALIAALLFGFSSTILTAKTLDARGELGALHGRTAIGVLILQDLVAIAILAYTSGSAPSPFSFGIILLPLLRPLLLWVFTLLKEDELALLYGLVLALGGAALFSWLGLSEELGAIAAGMILAGNDKADQLDQKLWSIKEFFLVGFFLEIGLRGLPDGNSGWLIGTMLLLVFVKAALFFMLFVLFRLRARTSFIAAASLMSYSEFMLIAGAVAARNGFIPEELIVTMALIIVISYAVNASLARWEDPIWNRLEGLLSRFERDVRHPDRQFISLGNAEYLVVGMGSAGCEAYNELRENGLRVVGMDIDPERIERNRENGRKIVYGDIQDIDMWQNLNLEPVKAVLIAMGNKQSKTNATRMMRELGYKGSIIALTMRPDERESLEKVGASAVSIPIRDAGRRLAEIAIEERNEEPGQKLTATP